MIKSDTKTKKAKVVDTKYHESVSLPNVNIGKIFITIYTNSLINETFGPGKNFFNQKLS